MQNSCLKTSAWWSHSSHFVENGYPSLRFSNMVKVNIHEYWKRVTRFNPLWVSAYTYRGLTYTYLGLTYTYRGLTYTYLGLTYTYLGLTYTYRGLTYTYLGLTYTYRGLPYTYLGLTYTYLGLTYTYRGLTYTYLGLTYTYRDLTYTYRSLTYTCLGLTYTYRDLTYTYRGLTYTYRGLAYTYRDSLYRDSTVMYFCGAFWWVRSQNVCAIQTVMFSFHFFLVGKKRIQIRGAKTCSRQGAWSQVTLKVHFRTLVSFSPPPCGCSGCIYIFPRGF